MGTICSGRQFKGVNIQISVGTVTEKLESHETVGISFNNDALLLILCSQS